MNYYEVLEVSPNASVEVIKAAYKSLMQRYHPDRNPDNVQAAERASLVIQAYELLSDSTKRAAYDIELGQQAAARLSHVQGRSRDVLSNAALVVKDSESSWFLWLIVALIILVGWLTLSPSKQQQSPEAGLRRHPETLRKEASQRANDAAARTIPIYLTDITVNLSVTSKSSGDTRHVLNIPILGVVVGTFDPDKFIQHIDSNSEFISQKLAEKLAHASYEVLVKPDGEEYLKKIILDSLGEITGTNRFEDYPSVGDNVPGHYGVVDVLFPESFSVQ